MNQLLKTITTPTAQTENLGNQAKNNAGGYSYEITRWEKLRRFLILGTESNTYYASNRELTKDSVSTVIACLREDGLRTVAIVKDVSFSGAAPKNDQAIFVLALAASDDNGLTRAAALKALPNVCRTSTHLFQFVNYIKRGELRGFGRALRRELANWYNEKELDSLGYQLVKYRQRDGWTHRDILRLAHPNATDWEKDNLYKWVVGKGCDTTRLPEIVQDFIRLDDKDVETDRALDADEKLAIVKNNSNIPWEAVPTELHNDPRLWETLVQAGMPTGALIRQLRRLTKLGVVGDLEQKNTDLVIEQLTNPEALKAARIHPLTILNALVAYRGRKAYGGEYYNPLNRNDEFVASARITDALDEAFYLAMDGLEPTGKRWMLSLDVSGSMDCGNIAGSALNPREASVALTLAQLVRGDSTVINGFCRDLTPLNISRKQRIEDAIDEVSRLPFGGTDCAQPMLHAIDKELEIDVFTVFTDNETWAGKIHPSEALKKYRKASGIDAKLIVCGMTVTDFSIADPEDPGMLDVVGFDTAAPEIMTSFAKGGWTNE